ncbi:TerD family protein [Actinomadura sp. WMMA1423]|uniref:TerD family protein n=1 Tax=Actinomadura sp. WMMA1423 TaxID=2591108 RepID=UPI0011462153|nr:TerD family protein [Actinomadura sp. WMMA1423]
MVGNEWALVDVETSGLRSARDRVLSLAVVTVGSDGRPGEEFSTLLDPGCDPGPVHVHGLTADRLRGAPRFENVTRRVASMLRGRVLVAHNAPFDYGFLAEEFRRASARLPVEQRLCTLALNRRLSPATTDLKLGTLAAHYGVEQRRSHDALEDVRTLAGVLRGSLLEATRLGLELPLVACPPKQSFPPRIPKTPCAFRSPGRFDGELVQGMKVVVTGETRTPREGIVERAVAAGLNVMTSVSRHTSILVTNHPGSGTVKARRAGELGVPVVDEATFLRLLERVRQGRQHGTPTRRAPREPSRPAEKPSAPAGPLEGRRVLVLGGTHPESSGARGRIVELGGAAAVNLSASVTDVLKLRGGENDRRMGRILDLHLPVHEKEWLDAPQKMEVKGVSPSVLRRGAVIDLPHGGRWTFGASWSQHASCEVDVVAFLLDGDGQVSCDDDFVFYGAAESPDGTVRLAADGPTEQAVVVDLAALPEAVRTVTVAAAIDGAVTFGELGAVEVTAGQGDGERVLAQATLDAGTTERTMLLAEVYRREGRWRLRVVGQGYDSGLDALARGLGVDVEDQEGGAATSGQAGGEGVRELV